MRHAITIISLLAFVLSGISPACAFISGKASASIEICTDDGIKTINLPGDLPGDAPEPHKHKKSGDCGFCFAQSHLKGGKADGFVFFSPGGLNSEKNFYTAALTIARFELSGLAARAPPPFA